MSNLTQAEQILLRLQEAGEDGVSNYELNKIAFRYAARIHELRKDGHPIVRQHIKGSQWRYYLDEQTTNNN